MSCGAMDVGTCGGICGYLGITVLIGYAARKRKGKANQPITPMDNNGLILTVNRCAKCHHWRRGFKACMEHSHHPRMAVITADQLTKKHRYCVKPDQDQIITFYKLHNRETGEDSLEFSRNIIFQMPCPACTSIKSCIIEGHPLRDVNLTFPEPAECDNDTISSISSTSDLHVLDTPEQLATISSNNQQSKNAVMTAAGGHSFGYDDDGFDDDDGDGVSDVGSGSGGHGDESGGTGGRKDDVHSTVGCWSAASNTSPDKEVLTMTLITIVLRLTSFFHDPKVKRYAGFCSVQASCYKDNATRLVVTLDTLYHRVPTETALSEIYLVSRAAARRYVSPPKRLKSRQRGKSRAMSSRRAVRACARRREAWSKRTDEERAEHRKKSMDGKKAKREARAREQQFQERTDAGFANGSQRREEISAREARFLRRADAGAAQSGHT